MFLTLNGIILSEICKVKLFLLPPFEKIYRIPGSCAELHTKTKESRLEENSLEQNDGKRIDEVAAFRFFFQFLQELRSPLGFLFVVELFFLRPLLLQKALTICRSQTVSGYMHDSAHFLVH
mgnify:CR=1 FL=1